MSDHTHADVQATDAPPAPEATTPTPADLAAQAVGTNPNLDDNGNDPAAQAQAEGIDALPEWAQREIHNLRNGEKKYRHRAKEVEEARTAELDAFKKEMAKALGLVDDQTDDPASLLEAATKREQEIAAERDTYAKQIRDFKQADAITTAISTIDGKVDTALLNAVLKSDNALSELDVNSDEYTAQVAQIVKSTIQSHPTLVQATRSTSGVDTSRTTNGARPLTRDDLKTMTPEDINKAARDGRLNHLLKES